MRELSLTALPPTYRAQPGCWNCCHKYEYLDHDTTTVNGDYYCTVDGTERPHSGSVAFEPAEGFDPEKWYEWALAHYVQPAGICDQWEANVWTEEELAAADLRTAELGRLLDECIVEEPSE